ncbi:MAG: sel1 repeat family protein [Salinicola sp.]|uniref:hypothetical protein n=1 Tax=Salinicola sp. TaxID=1978524 RepID=UPI001D3D3F16|nr:hypothetical protein [Salinicola sp.]NRB55068.1 sel1 repeat family protein [Salinicola sp.]
MKAFVIVLALFVPGVSWGEVLFQDPTGKALSNAIANLPDKVLEEISPQDLGLQQYLMGLFYIKGAPEFRVEKNCRKAVSSLQSAWQNGVSDAAYTLSTMYYNGICVSRDLENLGSWQVSPQRTVIYLRNVC